MKILIDNIKQWKFLIGLIISIIVAIWAVFVLFNNFMKELELIQQMTLKNTIWNDNIPLNDRIESCDRYLKLGFNSKTKKYCEVLLERSE